MSVLSQTVSTINLVATDKKNQTSNQFDVEVADGNGTKFNFYFKRDNLRMIPGEYDLTVSSKNISHWVNAKRTCNIGLHWRLIAHTKVNLTARII